MPLMKTEKQYQVVIVGGGFAGIEVAKKLSKNKSVRVTLISKNSYFEYYPALYKLVTGALAIEVCTPYEKIFPKGGRVSVVEGVYKSYDKDQKTVLLSDGKTFSYDYLVIGLGSETNYFNIPGIEQYAFSFKSAEEALTLKDHFRDILQESKDISNDDLVKRFHVTIVGGGPSGVELAGDITTYLRTMARRYHIDPSFVTVDLIESNPRVLAMLPESVSKVAEARLRRLKVNLYTNRRLQAQDFDEITASAMKMKGGTVIWTAGTKINDLFNTLPLDTRKRVAVKNDFTLPEDESVFVVGDGASMPGTGLAQGAISHGAYVGDVISKKIQGKKSLPYKSKSMGYLVPVGHNWAVFSYKKITVSGFIPWILRSFVDFRYFTTIVPLMYVFDVFRQGAKYRREGVNFYD